MRDVRFFKGHGIGNDYLVVDRADLDVELTPARAQLLCDRHYGAGSDGVLLCDLTAAPIHLRIINPDGTEAEKSGNGLRIFGAYLYHRGLVQRDEWFDIRLARDVVSMRVEAELDAGAVLIRARMGRAEFLSLDEELHLARGTARVNSISLGNPHCVTFVDELVRADFLERAPQLCTHPAFAAGTNVQFARVIDRGRVEAWIWERGAGETLASGSSACAVAAASVRRGFVDTGDITVQMPGGTLDIHVSEEYEIELLGPAQMIFEGKLLSGPSAAW